jgi:single-strand DNA-binding protein
MSGVNKAILIGNLGADPELKWTAGNQAVMRMRLATSEKWQDKTGAKQERTSWHTVVVWGRRAEALSKFLVKGKTLYIEGRIDYQEWEKDGVKHYKTEIVANEIEVLGGKGDGQQRQPEERRPQTLNGPRDQGDDFGGSDDGFDEDSIPFR